MTSPSSRLSPTVRTLLARAIAGAGGPGGWFVGAGGSLPPPHPGCGLAPAPADLSIAARLHDGGIGFGIVNNAGTELFVVVEVPRRKSVTRLATFAVLATLGHGGPIAARMGAFEDRQGQRDMAAHMADAYNDGGVVLLEAGTGVGKSFAYLVPALAWAKANGERTVVSTNTINL